MCERSDFAVHGPRPSVHNEESFTGGCHHILTKQTCKIPIINGVVVFICRSIERGEKHPALCFNVLFASPEPLIGLFGLPHFVSFVETGLPTPVIISTFPENTISTNREKMQMCVYERLYYYPFSVRSIAIKICNIKLTTAYTKK